jgi:hypothetical protein
MKTAKLAFIAGLVAFLGAMLTTLLVDMQMLPRAAFEAAIIFAILVNSVAVIIQTINE